MENVAPAATDNLIWDSTRTAAGLYSFGNGQFTGGVTIQNPGGLVQLRVASNGTTTWANSALIDMSAATVNAEWTAGTLRIDSNNSSPAVTVAPGRTLTIGGSGISNRANSKTLSMLGSGDIVINAVMGGGAMNLWINGPTVTMNAASSGWSTGIQTLTGANSYTGGTSIEGGSVVLNAEGAKLGSGPVTLSNGANLTMFRGNANDNNTFPAFSNELIIPSGQSGSFYSMPRGTWSGALSGAGTLDDVQYLLANYSGTLTGTFAVSPPTGYTFDYGTGTNSQIKLVSTSAPAGYSSWASLNGASANANEDHDNDGVPNGIEFFIGGPDGNTTGFTPLPGVATVGSSRSATWTHAADYTGTYGSDHVIQSSTTLALGSWTNETLGGNVVVSGNNVTYTFPAGPVKNFARLVVTP